MTSYESQRNCVACIGQTPSLRETLNPVPILKVSIQQRQVGKSQSSACYCPSSHMPQGTLGTAVIPCDASLYGVMPLIPLLSILIGRSSSGFQAKPFPTGEPFSCTLNHGCPNAQQLTEGSDTALLQVPSGNWAHWSRVHGWQSEVLTFHPQHVQPKVFR